MPTRRRKVRGPDGREFEALEMPFQVGTENWNEYFCDDGSVVRLKPVVTEIFRVEGQYDQMGNPVYVVNSTNVVVVSAPEELRRED
jgi:hypothetical protein